MSFEFFLARRFLFGRRFGIFRWVTTAIAVGGTSLGVAALLITLAVMDGFRNDIQDKILGTQPHIVVVSPYGSPLVFEPEALKQLQTSASVQGASPFVSGQALIQTGRSMLGVLIRGVDPETEGSVTHFKTIFTEGNPQALKGNAIAVGSELAQTLGLKLGQVVSVIAPQDPEKGLQQMPRLRKYTVVALFKSGMYEIDANMSYLPRETAQELFGLGNRISGYGVRAKSMDAVTHLKTDLQKELGQAYWIRSWQDLNRNLFSAIQLERTVMFIVLTLIILVSTFIIVSNLLLLTIEKAPEIGILQALGASSKQIGRIFLLHGMLLGMSGVGLGLILGCGITFLLERYPIIKLPPDVYYVDRLPIELSITTVESVAACALFLVFLAILYPAKKAREMDPIQAIRHG